MQKYLLILLTSTIFFSFTKDTTIMDVKEKTVTINDIPVYNFESLEPLLYTDSNKIHIVNFWAMWCAPCIKELPILKELEKNNPNVEITLVSLDFPEDIETRLKPFLERKGITSKVVLLDDPDQNSWINKIDPNWSGAIPFTIIFNNENRTFHERAFNNIKDLENEVYNTINK
ncbi:TlpA family protein disulfide reductase [Maribacter dokdonensis]|uniref:TlpA family protein disulfide reductase n=1 Tax=Maribacter dokdonensis TaxID=320912 RepID=UPI001FD61F8F|nr:TlpA disulfide reductase family protein [Maribacter dokdonensis]